MMTKRADAPAQADDADCPTIRQARLCSKCEYNLYGLARAGECPECGHPYKRRRQDAIEKNPRRQLGSLRYVLRRRQSELRWLPAWWVIPSAAVALCVVFGAKAGWWVLAVFSTLIAAGHTASVVFNYRDAKRKIEAVDAANREEA
jgi:hypothetical protein